MMINRLHSPQRISSVSTPLVQNATNSVVCMITVLVSWECGEGVEIQQRALEVTGLT